MDDSAVATQSLAGGTMLIAEATVETERSRRYLVQLCRHVSLVAKTHPQMQAHVDWSDDRGMISFGSGRCTLRADPGVLTLHAEAADEESLHQLEQRVADRLEQVGRRDRLTVTWTPPQSARSSCRDSRQARMTTGENTHMTDPPRRPEISDDDSGLRYDRESSAGIPRWVKLVGIIVAVLALLVVLVLLVGGGGHGPSRHSL
jgi:hypothetical protein